MVNLNPMQLIGLLRQGNPQMVVQQIIQNNFPNDPTMMNLLRMGQNGDVQGLSKIAQQMLGSQGMDFQNELSKLIQACQR